MGLLTMLGGPIISAMANSLFGTLEQGWEAYVKKEITKEQLLEKLQEALLSTFAEVEKAYADSLAKTWASFMGAVEKSPLMQAVWATVVLSQLVVLVWHQMGIPLVVYATGHGYPSSGTTVDWAYALIAAMCGLGPVMLQNGAGNIAASIKNLVRG